MLRIYSHHIYTKICRKIFGQAQLSRLKPQLKLSLSSIFAVRPESAIRNPESGIRHPESAIRNLPSGWRIPESAILKKYNFQSYSSPNYIP